MKNYKIILSIIFTAVIFFFIWMEYKAYQIRNIINESFNWLSETLPNWNSNEWNEEKNNFIKIDKNIWETVNLKTMDIKIDKSIESDSITSRFSSPKIAKEWTKFIIIDINVKNTTKSPFSDYFNDIALEDNNGNNYLPTSAIWLIDNYIEWRELAPQIEEKWKLVYEIPLTTNSYYFKVWKSWTNEVYYIKLK